MSSRNTTFNKLCSLMLAITFALLPVSAPSPVYASELLGNNQNDPGVDPSDVVLSGGSDQAASGSLLPGGALTSTETEALYVTAEPGVKNVDLTFVTEREVEDDEYLEVVISRPDLDASENPVLIKTFDDIASQVEEDGTGTLKYEMNVHLLESNTTYRVVVNVKKKADDALIQETPFAEFKTLKPSDVIHDIDGLYLQLERALEDYEKGNDEAIESFRLLLEEFKNYELSEIDALADHDINTDLEYLHWVAEISTTYPWPRHPANVPRLIFERSEAYLTDLAAHEMNWGGIDFRMISKFVEIMTKAWEQGQTIFENPALGAFDVHPDGMIDELDIDAMLNIRYLHKMKRSDFKAYLFQLEAVFLALEPDVRTEEILRGTKDYSSVLDLNNDDKIDYQDMKLFFGTVIAERGITDYKYLTRPSDENEICGLYGHFAELCRSREEQGEETIHGNLGGSDEAFIDLDSTFQRYIADPFEQANLFILRFLGGPNSVDGQTGLIDWSEGHPYGGEGFAEYMQGFYSAIMSSKTSGMDEFDGLDGPKYEHLNLGSGQMLWLLATLNFLKGGKEGLDEWITANFGADQIEKFNYGDLFMRDLADDGEWANCHHDIPEDEKSFLCTNERGDNGFFPITHSNNNDEVDLHEPARFDVNDAMLPWKNVSGDFKSLDDWLEEMIAKKNELLGAFEESARYPLNYQLDGKSIFEIKGDLLALLGNASGGMKGRLLSIGADTELVDELIAKLTNFDGSIDPGEWRAMYQLFEKTWDHLERMILTYQGLLDEMEEMTLEMYNRVYAAETSGLLGNARDRITDLNLSYHAAMEAIEDTLDTYIQQDIANDSGVQFNSGIYDPHYPDSYFAGILPFIKEDGTETTFQQYLEEKYGVPFEFLRHEGDPENYPIGTLGDWGTLGFGSNEFSSAGIQGYRLSLLAHYVASQNDPFLDARIKEILMEAHSIMHTHSSGLAKALYEEIFEPLFDGRTGIWSSELPETVAFTEDSMSLSGIPYWSREMQKTIRDHGIKIYDENEAYLHTYVAAVEALNRLHYKTLRKAKDIQHLIETVGLVTRFEVETAKAKIEHQAQVEIWLLQEKYQNGEVSNTEYDSLLADINQALLDDLATIDVLLGGIDDAHSVLNITEVGRHIPTIMQHLLQNAVDQVNADLNKEQGADENFSGGLLTVAKNSDFIRNMTRSLMNAMRVVRGSYDNDIGLPNVRFDGVGQELGGQDPLDYGMFGGHNHPENFRGAYGIRYIHEKVNKYVSDVQAWVTFNGQSMTSYRDLVDSVEGAISSIGGRTSSGNEIIANISWGTDPNKSRAAIIFYQAPILMDMIWSHFNQSGALVPSFETFPDFPYQWWEGQPYEHTDFTGEHSVQSGGFGLLPGDFEHLIHILEELRACYEGYGSGGCSVEATGLYSSNLIQVVTQGFIGESDSGYSDLIGSWNVPYDSEGRTGRQIFAQNYEDACEPMIGCDEEAEQMYHPNVMAQIDALIERVTSTADPTDMLPQLIRVIDNYKNQISLYKQQMEGYFAAYAEALQGNIEYFEPDFAFDGLDHFAILKDGDREDDLGDRNWDFLTLLDKTGRRNFHHRTALSQYHDIMFKTDYPGKGAAEAYDWRLWQIDSAENLFSPDRKLDHIQVFFDLIDYFTAGMVTRALNLFDKYDQTLRDYIHAKSQNRTELDNWKDKALETVENLKKSTYVKMNQAYVNVHELIFGTKLIDPQPDLETRIDWRPGSETPIIPKPRDVDPFDQIKTEGDPVWAEVIGPDVLNGTLGTRTDFSLVVFDPKDGRGERMVAIGGITGNGEISNEVWVSFDGVTWEQQIADFGKSLPNLAHHAAIVYPDKKAIDPRGWCDRDDGTACPEPDALRDDAIYVVGGITENPGSVDEKYNTMMYRSYDGINWEPVGDMLNPNGDPVKLKNHQLVSYSPIHVDGEGNHLYRIYVIGGEHHGELSDKVYSWHEGEGAGGIQEGMNGWRQLPIQTPLINLPTVPLPAVTNHSVATGRGRPVMVFGGNGLDRCNHFEHQGTGCDPAENVMYWSYDLVQWHRQYMGNGAGEERFPQNGFVEAQAVQVGYETYMIGGENSPEIWNYRSAADIPVSLGRNVTWLEQFQKDGETSAIHAPIRGHESVFFKGNIVTVGGAFEKLDVDGNGTGEFDAVPRVHITYLNTSYENTIGGVRVVSPSIAPNLADYELVLHVVWSDGTVEERIYKGNQIAQFIDGPIQIGSDKSNRLNITVSDVLRDETYATTFELVILGDGQEANYFEENNLKLGLSQLIDYAKALLSGDILNGGMQIQPPSFWDEEAFGSWFEKVRAFAKRVIDEILLNPVRYLMNAIGLSPNLGESWVPDALTGQKPTFNPNNVFDHAGYLEHGNFDVVRGFSYLEHRPMEEDRLWRVDENAPSELGALYQLEEVTRMLTFYDRKETAAGLNATLYSVEQWNRVPQAALDTLGIDRGDINPMLVDIRPIEIGDLAYPEPASDIDFLAQFLVTIRAWEPDGPELTYIVGIDRKNDDQIITLPTFETIDYFEEMLTDITPPFLALEQVSAGLITRDSATIRASYTGDDVPQSEVQVVVLYREKGSDHSFKREVMEVDALSGTNDFVRLLDGLDPAQGYEFKVQLLWSPIDILLDETELLFFRTQGADRRWYDHLNAIDEMDGLVGGTVTEFDPGDGKGKRLYAIGGFYGVNNYHKNDVWVSFDGVNWTKLNQEDGFELPQIGSHETVVLDGALYVIGGLTTTDEADVALRQEGRLFNKGIWRSVDGRHWEKVTEVTNGDGTVVGLSQFSAIVTQLPGETREKIYIIGGSYSDNIGPASDKILSYHPDEGWSELPKPDPSAITDTVHAFPPRSLTSAAVAPDGSIYIAGGKGTSDCTPENFETCPQADERLYRTTDMIHFEFISELPKATASSQLVVYQDLDGNPELWLIGGGGDDNLQNVPGKVYAYSLHDGSGWRDVTDEDGSDPMPFSLVNHSAVTFDNPLAGGKQVVVVGGLFHERRAGHLSTRQNRITYVAGDDTVGPRIEITDDQGVPVSLPVTTRNPEWYEIFYTVDGHLKPKIWSGNNVKALTINPEDWERDGTITKGYNQWREGSNYILIESEDVYGNTGFIVYELIVDTRGGQGVPTGNLNINGDQLWTTNSNITLNFMGIESPDEIVAVQYRINGGTFKTLEGFDPNLVNQDVGITLPDLDGEYVIDVILIDVDGDKAMLRNTIFRDEDAVIMQGREANYVNEWRRYGNNGIYRPWKTNTYDQAAEFEFVVPEAGIYEVTLTGNQFGEHLHPDFDFFEISTWVNGLGNDILYMEASHDFKTVSFKVELQAGTNTLAFGFLNDFYEFDSEGGFHWDSNLRIENIRITPVPADATIKIFGREALDQHRGWFRSGSNGIYRPWHATNLNDAAKFEVEVAEAGRYTIKLAGRQYGEHLPDDFDDFEIPTWVNGVEGDQILLEASHDLRNVSFEVDLQAGVNTLGFGFANDYYSFDMSGGFFWDANLLIESIKVDPAPDGTIEVLGNSAVQRPSWYQSDLDGIYRPWNATELEEAATFEVEVSEAGVYEVTLTGKQHGHHLHPDFNAFEIPTWVNGIAGDVLLLEASHDFKSVTFEVTLHAGINTFSFGYQNDFYQVSSSGDFFWDTNLRIEGFRVKKK